MTQMTQARAGRITAEMRAAARAEKMQAARIRAGIADGYVALPCNRNRGRRGLCPVGGGTRTKVNANIGTSSPRADVEAELAKLRAAEDAGADTVMDLSTGGDLRAIRKRICEETRITLGSVPVYEAVVSAARGARRGLAGMKARDFIEAVRMHCEDGVDFVTIHSGVRRSVLEILERSPRTCGVVSRGGAFTVEWMTITGNENPLYEQFDELLDMALEYDVTMSLGDGLRPGAISDAFDQAQVYELNVLAELVERCRAAGVQCMVEGPGHVPLHQIQAQVRLQKELCKGAPFYVLGPLVTDVAPGYDHITSAIGGALAAWAGADYLCYVTPTEHLGLPGPEAVRQGVITARIAAHAADIARGLPGAAEWDRNFSLKRYARDWEGQIKGCIDPLMAEKLRRETGSEGEDVCTMCGDLCAMKVFRDHPDSPRLPGGGKRRGKKA
ncbi:MAG TPA: phosphomethylpyrimidine synthase ThiC [Candidatus Brocadiia bacterium]|nr:phosphomethylpyrimidine synthase ThiC [Candidatus Brocadiia bacterium]